MSCLCVAHRGFSHSYPENTLLAVRKAIETGADAVEFDVRCTRDRVAVLLHDETVDRTTDGTGEMAELSWAAVQRLDAGSWKGEGFAGEGVPRLAEALRVLKGTAAKAVVEVKADGIAREVVAATREADAAEQVAVISFSERACAGVHALAPGLPVALLVGDAPAGGVAEQADELCRRAEQCGATALDLSHRMLSGELVAELRRRGFPVWCWTVNEPVLFDHLARWGVGAITTDCPDRLVAWRRRRAAPAPHASRRRPPSPP